MFSEIRLSGFQGFGRTKTHTAPLKPLTLIYGPNASGKSSILRAIKLMNQSAGGPGGREQGFIFEGREVSLASFANVSHRHDTSTTEPLSLGVTYDTSFAANQFDAISELFRAVRIDWSLYAPGVLGLVELQFYSRTESDNDLKMAISASKDGKRWELTDLHGNLGQLGSIAEHPNFAADMPKLPNFFRKDSLENKELEWTFEQAKHDLIKGFWADDFLDFMRFGLSGIFPTARSGSDRDGVNKPLYSSADIAEDPDGAVRAMFLEVQARIFSSLLGMVSNLGRRASSGTSSIAPLRDIQGRLNFDTSAIRAERDRLEEKGDLLEKQISSWLERLTGGRYSYKRVTFVPEEVSIFGALESAQVIDNQTGTQVAFADVGVGLSQVLPILEVLASRQRLGGGGKTILIEQPELHLHPKMQAELAQLFVEVVSSRRVQVIAETHSEAFLLRVQKCLRDGKLSPSDVQVLYVDSVLPERIKLWGTTMPDESHPDEYFMMTNTIREIELSADEEFEAELPQSFAGLRLSEYL